MNPDDLISPLRTLAKHTARPGAGCPDEEEIAGYVEGALAPLEHEHLERHLADCSACLALVGLLVRERDTSTEERVPPEVLAAVASTGTTRRPGRNWHQMAHWAVAATVVLTVPLLVYLGRPASSPEPATQLSAPEVRSTRTMAPAQQALRLIAPAAGSAVDKQHLDFRWNAIPGSPYYDVRIVTDDGTLVTEQRIAGTEWRQSALPAGDYYIHVDAYPAGDKALSSEHVPFRVTD